MDLGIKGKVAMVAAGTRGIGLATAESLLKEGAKVSICSRSEENIKEAQEKLAPYRNELLVVKADVTSTKDISHWIRTTRENLGPIEILVTNTGGPPAADALAATDEQWMTGFDSTVLNIVRLVREVAPFMLEKNWGRIVHVTSLVAKEPSKLLSISSTLRAGLMSLTKLQAKELGPFGVTVNSILPGHTLTDRQIHLAEIEAEKKKVSVDEILKEKTKIIPVGRIASPEEIGSVITFLCSKQAGYLTGENILVDGGVTKAL